MIGQKARLYLFFRIEERRHSRVGKEPWAGSEGRSLRPRLALGMSCGLSLHLRVLICQMRGWPQ